MTTPELWLAVFLQGGGLGIFGDYSLSDQSRYGRRIGETVLGPVVSTGRDLYDLTIGNLHQSARGEPAETGAELVRFVQVNTPGASLWHTRAALEHLLLHETPPIVQGHGR